MGQVPSFGYGDNGPPQNWDPPGFLMQEKVPAEEGRGLSSGKRFHTYLTTCHTTWQARLEPTVMGQ